MLTATTLITPEPLGFNEFPAWAVQLTEALGLELIEQEQGADYHQWLLAFEGSRVLLCFQHYADCAWLQPFSAADQAVVDWLAQQWHRLAAG